MESAGNARDKISLQGETEHQTPSKFTRVKTRKRKLPCMDEIDSEDKPEIKRIMTENTRTKELFMKSKRCCRKLFAFDTNDALSTMHILPDELLMHLILYLKPKEIGRLSCTCRRLCSIVSQNYVWRSLCRSHFPTWNDRVYDKRSDSPQTSTLACVHPFVGKCWKRQYIINSTKGIFYQRLGGGSRGKNIYKVIDTPTGYGFKKLCCSRGHVFALDFTGTLHVYRSRWERDQATNEFTYSRASWHREFSNHVVDITVDPRYDNIYRRYVYVLSQSAFMQNKRQHSTARNVEDGWNEYGVPSSGDKIDVFDDRSCRRVFNMTFDPEMRFTSIKLTSAESQQKTLFMLTDAGKVYSLHLFEPSLLNLGTEGLQVTLKSASKCLGEKVKAINTSVGIISFITVTGKVHLITQRPGEFYDLFGRATSARLGVPLPIRHVAKVVQCSIGGHHIGFIDEYRRAFAMGNNRYGQLGTGDRMDRAMPTHVLCNKNVRALHCSLNHTLAVIRSRKRCSVYGSGCGNNGRLPGLSRGSVEFLKLNIKIPWSTRQIDTNKECVFVLSCLDIEEKSPFQTREISDNLTKDVLVATPKSLQELLMDMKKASLLGEKVKVIEAMIEKLARSVLMSAALDVPQFQTVAQSSTTMPTKFFTDTQGGISELDISFLRHAAEILRHEVERVQLDVEILKRNHS